LLIVKQLKMSTQGIFFIDFLIGALLLYDENCRPQGKQPMPLQDTEHTEMSPTEGQCLPILVSQYHHGAPLTVFAVSVLMGSLTPWYFYCRVR
jgi:hypothetical protein